MTSGRAGFVVGCVTGSIATAVLLWWWQQQSQRSSKTEDEEAATQRLTSLSKSSANRNQNPSILLQSTRSLDDEDGSVPSSFLTDLVRELWDYLNVAGAAVIRSSVEPYFADLPGPLKTLRFTKMDLGTSPLRMDNLMVRRITPDGMIQVDFDMVWNGHCDLQLQADQSSMIAFGVQELKLSGKFSLWFKPLTNELPIISGIQYAFINPPHVDLQFTGLAQVADSPLLTKSVRDAINASLLCVVLPNRMLYKMQASNKYLDTYQPPVGIVRVTAVKGRGFVIEKKLIGKDDIPDVYLNITLGANPTVWRTQTIRDNLQPEWKESRDYLLHDYGQKLRFHAWDEDNGPLDNDDDLGRGSALIEEVLKSKQRRLEVELLDIKTQKRTDAYVTMECQLFPWTADLSSLDSVSNDNNNNKQQDGEIGGLLVVIVNGASHIPLPREQAATFCKVTFCDQEFQTKTVLDYPGYADGLNPLYETAFEIPIRPGMPITGANAKVTLQLVHSPAAVLVDAKNQSKSPPPDDQVLGSLSVDFDSLRSATNHTLTETKPIGEGGASLEYRVSLCGVDRGSSSAAANSNLQPGASSPRVLPSNSSMESESSAAGEDSIGRVRLTVVKGRGLKISAELFNIDVPDGYCRIQFGSSKHIWTTSVQRNNCLPTWNESKEYNLKSHSQVIALDVYDKNERSYDPDVYLGSAKTTVGNILLAGGSTELELTTKQGRATQVFITLRCELI